jgi:hypothetical protein
MKLAALASAAAWAALTPAAQAGEAACWYEEGVVVAPASIAGLAGDYIIDTAAPATLLHETKGQAAGYTSPDQRGEVRIAGLTLVDRPFAVVDLDARTAAFPTPIAGVIGADILSAYVVDIGFSPCRIAIRPPGEAPAFGPAIALPFQPGRALPTARATVSDGLRAFGADFLVSTGADTAIRLDTRLASVPGAAEPDRLLPNGGLKARLAAMSFAGRLSTRLSAGLMRGSDPDLAGVIGAPFLAQWRMRFDYPGRRVLLGR